jgi:hypothetical protein
VLVNSQGAGLIGQTATITGSGFTISEGNPSSVVISVTFNGVPADGTVTSYGSLTATIPNGATTGIVRVTVVGGTFAESPDVFVVGTLPYIRRFSPGAGLVGNSVTIFGENFNLGFNGASSVTGVQFGGVNVTSGANSIANQVTVNVPVGAETGPVTILTTTGSFSTATNFFLSPTVTNLSPASGVSGQTITIQGRNLTGTTRVRFNGLDAASFNVLNNSNLTAVVPVGVRRGKVAVTTPGGSIESTNDFLVPPVITSFTPNVGGPGTAVTVTGTNLIKVSAVTLAGVSVGAFTTNAAGNQLGFTVPNGVGTGRIAITTDSGTSESTNLFYQPPKITSVNPSFGVGGDLTFIGGQNFDDVIAVRISGVATVFQVTVTNTQIRATVPHGVLTGPLTVETPGGIVTNLANFQIQPRITGFNPASGAVGDVVTITGTNFTTNAVVRFFTNRVAATTYLSGTQLQAVVPANAQTGKISVETDGGSVQAGVDFTVLVPNVTLQILRSNANVIVSWPVTSGVWTLQKTTNLNLPIIWTTNSAPTSTVGGAFQVTLPAGQPLETFRLLRP